MTVAAPIAMLAELTHRCPLACPYCSNSVDLTRRSAELGTEVWVDAFQQAAQLGVLQIHLSGGEPASRPDLVQLVTGARDAGLYTNLITSGIGVTEARLDALVAAGLDHVQLSLQGTNTRTADWIGHYKGGFERKMKLARLIRDRSIPLTLNAVMHRHNLDQLDKTFDLALELKARRLEIACVQFHGWASENRAQLMPTRAQTEETKQKVESRTKDLAGTMAIDFVPPDYHADYPKTCMGGWGSAGLNISPDGTVLPCHAAETIKSLTFERITDRPLRDIWYNSEAFNAYRGVDWMPEPCRSCARREADFGGCRCQALAITGDASATDPVCHKSPHHHLVREMVEVIESDSGSPFTYRRPPGK